MSATCPTSSPVRTRERRKLPSPAPALRAGVKSARPSCHAGATPASRPVRRATATVKQSTRPSSAGLSPGTLGRRNARITGPTHSVTSSAPVPPASPSSALSVRSCRARRRRPAPMASRTAISRCRCIARASNRFATLAQAMRSTMAETAASQVDTLASRDISGPRACCTGPSRATSSGLRCQ